MINYLAITSSLEDYGDELVRFQISTTSKDFSGSILAWGYASQLAELADHLVSFPKADNQPVTFQFGSEKTGSCKIEFVCLDGAGHCGVWVTLEAAYPVSYNQGFEKASIFFHVEPAAIDRFSAALRLFSSGATHESLLHGIAP